MRSLFLTIWLPALASSALVLCGCGSDRSTGSGRRAPTSHSESSIRKFCGDCHAFPEPEMYPRHLWPEKVQEGYKFYYSSLRHDLTVPPIDSVEAFYISQAPEQLEIAPSSRLSDNSPTAIFAPAQKINLLAPLKTVAELRGLHSPAPQKLLVCDMGSGEVRMVATDGTSPTSERPSERLGHFRNPCRIRATDLDQDGRVDYVIGDLGSFLPEDHTFGTVWRLTSSPAGTWSQEILMEDLGRVVDVQPVDVDHDGDLDLIVAEFGWRTTGHLLLLRNTPAANGAPHFTKEILDDRHGAIDVPVTDLNGDGHPDFIALISQEFEVIVAFINRGNGTFDKHEVFNAQNPGFGSSCIQLADLDADGDQDIVYANGDSLDTPIAHPYHGVRWLENLGESHFQVHEVGLLPGAHCVRIGDLDGDNDLDIAAVALLPGRVTSEAPPEAFDSIVWFEQTARGIFQGHSLEKKNCVHASCELWDWDQDGDLDLIVGDTLNDPAAQSSLTLFRNRTRQSGTTTGKH